MAYEINPIDRTVGFAIGMATAEYFARGFRIERALEIVMAYHGLAPWRIGDRRRLVIEESGDPMALDLMVRQTIRIRIDNAVAFSLEWDGIESKAGRERWFGRCAALNGPSATRRC